jgi:hypothetical protein
MRLQLCIGHSFAKTSLEILDPYLNREVKLEEVPFDIVNCVIEEYIKETDTLVIDSARGYGCS